MNRLIGVLTQKAMSSLLSFCCDIFEILLLRTESSCCWEVFLSLMSGRTDKERSEYKTVLSPGDTIMLLTFLMFNLCERKILELTLLK